MPRSLGFTHGKSGFHPRIFLDTATYATNYLALNLLGFCQYISPILTLVLGIFVYQESFGWEKIYPMLFVWLGIVLFIFGQRKIRRFRLSR